VLDDKHSRGDIVTPTVSYHGEGNRTTVHDRGVALDRNRGPGSTVEDLSQLHSRVLGDFVLGAVLGQGGCGTVYRAEQRSLGRRAVVKVLHRSLTARRDIAERFAREARLASRFDHPYAAHIYSFGVEHDGLMWIAMELVDGTPLGHLIQRSGPLSVEHFVPLFERLCDVVQAAHDQGIVHRDIKPSNVIVIERAGRLMPKLLDFGIAKSIGDAAVEAAQTQQPFELGLPHDAGPARETVCSLTREGQVLGSPVYMAPEQWLDATSAGPPADQYALALVAYEAVTGSRAFNGPSLDALAQQHRDAGLPALPEHLPPQLHAVLARACDKLPERRFAHLMELANAVRNAALGAPRELELSMSTIEVAPYPGLAAYTADDGASFVGRERDLAELLDRLRTHAFVTVVGPSGSGKTSFLAAGLTPALAPGWRTELIRPGSDPPGALAAITAKRDVAPYRDEPRDGSAMQPTALAAGLIGLAEARGISLVMIVDQAEELFTMCADQDRRTAFAEALVAACDSARIRVVLALRDDFLCRVEQLPAWRGRLGRAVHVLGSPSRDELERMLTVPARRCGYEFDDPALPREIVAEIDNSPGALPLIAFTAARLWEYRDQGTRRLTRDAYQRIGGVIGALVQHADSVIDRMPIPDRRHVRRIFQRLISADGTRALISRSELEDSLGGTSAASVIDRLVAARLIVSRDDERGDCIEVIHETLATTWPRLASWRRDDAEGARFQEQLAGAARHWHERGSPADLLWRGDALSDLRRWQQAADRTLTPIEHAFARASFRLAIRTRRRRLAVAALMFALLIAGIVGLVSANRQIAGERATAVDRLRASLEEHGRLATAEGDSARGMLYLAEASRLGARGASFDLLASYARTSLDGGMEVLGTVGGGIVAMDLDPSAILTVDSELALWRWDRTGRKALLAGQIHHAVLVGDLVIAISGQGDLVAMDGGGGVRWRAERVVADPSMRPAGIAGSVAARLVVAFGRNATLWELETGRAYAELAHEKGINVIALAHDGTRLATADGAGVVRIWDTARAQRIATCEQHGGMVRDLKFTADRRNVVSGGNDGEVRVCDAGTGATLHRLIGHSQQVLSVDIAGDGSSIVSGGRDGKPRLWDARTGMLIRTLEGHRGAVAHVEHSPDDRQILTLGIDGTARIWSREGLALGSLQGHGGPIFKGRWDLDSQHVITTSLDGTIRRWDPARAIRTAFRQADTGPIGNVVISPDDRWILTTSANGRGVVWDRQSLESIAELPHGGAVLAAVLGPDGRSVLTVDDTGSAATWQLPTGVRVTEFGPRITAAIYARDGGVITASGTKIAFWTPAGVERGTTDVDHTVRQLLVDASGRWLFAAGNAGTVQVIDIATRSPLVRLDVRDRQVMAIAADDTRVAITDGATIRLWQIGTWVPLGVLRGHKYPVTNMWFLSGGQLVSAGADATLVWDRDARLSGRLTDTNMTFKLAMSSDGAWFATTASDGAIRIWDAASYRLLLQLPAHRLPAFALALTHDDTSVISGGNDGRLVTWNLTRRTYSPAELADIVRCRVPLRLEGDVVLPRDLDFVDPKCRSLELNR
jgi:WD40 repeat protein/serine/threonine protein kinase